MKRKKVVVIGAGPAGLTAGVELLATEKFEITILEKDSVVGGIAKTTDYKGYKFDIGPHHYITDSPKIEKWWIDLMGDDFIKLNRFTRIFYKKRFFNYPLQALNVIKGLNLFECTFCVFSYFKYRFSPIKKVKSFQDWVTNRFGKRLFNIFFKTYTEKVWGIKCSELSAEWAAERIKTFSMSKAIFYAFFGKWFKKNAPRTLSTKFYYPMFGSGTLWNKVASNFLSESNSKISNNESVVKIEHNNYKVLAVNTISSLIKSGVNNLKRYETDYMFSSMPLKALILSLDPVPSAEIVQAANFLKYRALVTVNLVVNKKDIFPDHWLYIHDESVKMGRIGNMNNFSKYLVANENHTALSLEYFTYVDGEFWNKSDSELLNIGKKELEDIGIAKQSDIVDGMILRCPKAYPVYDDNYKKSLSVIFDYLSNFSNLKLMGRNGLHRYDNMDQAMLAAMRVVDEVCEFEKLNISRDVKKTYSESSL
jgi:protoporphyrinogen oxidase